MNLERLNEYKRARHLPGPGIINRYWLKGTLTTESPLHIGTGEVERSWKRRGDDRDRTASKNCNYVVLEHEGVGGGAARNVVDGHPEAKPVIPGTSLRGTLRSFLEGLLYPYNSAADRCEVASLSSTEYESDRAMDRDTQRQALLGEESLAAYLLEESDLVGFLLGTTHVRGRVSFGNCTALYKGKKRIEQRVEARECFVIHTGVSIDRDTGAAAESKLYDVELVRPGVGFEVDIRFSNVRYWEIGMVLLALEAFNHPVFPLHLGGLTQHGYGHMRWAPGVVYQLGADEASQRPPIADWFAGTDAQGAPGTALEIGRRGIPGVTDSPVFVRHCIQAFQEVMDHVCA